MKYQTSNSAVILPVSGWLILLGILLLVMACNSSNEKKIIPSEAPKDSLDYYTNLVISTTSDRKAKAYFHRARLFYERNAYDAALKDLRAALKLDSSREETYLLKSQVEMDYFRSMDALRTLQHAAKRWPESFRLKLELAQTHLILRQYAEARKEAQNALSINPMAARPYLILGVATRDSQDTTTAIKYLQKAVQNDADLLDAWIELARLQMQKDPTKAGPYFQSALQIAPDDARIRHAYAMYWQELDSLDRAKEMYDHMIRHDSQFVEAYYNHALILMDQDSFHKAIPLWSQYIMRAPDPSRGYYYRGICREMTHEFNRALHDYKRARELNPDLENIDDAIRSVQEK